MRQGEIWWVKFLNSVGHEYQKERPALIIAADSQLRRSGLATIMPFTSSTNNRIDEDILVSKDSQNKLYYDSILKVHHIQSFDRSRFIKLVGAVGEDIMRQVKSYLKKHFDI